MNTKKLMLVAILMIVSLSLFATQWINIYVVYKGIAGQPVSMPVELVKDSKQKGYVSIGGYNLNKKVFEEAVNRCYLTGYEAWWWSTAGDQIVFVTIVDKKD